MEEVPMSNEKNERLKQLEATLKAINADKKYKSSNGPNDTLIAKLSDKPLAVETISSGSLVLDELLGGGFGRGRIIEIYGAESSGKTSIALTAVANVQRNLKGTAVFIDAENALDPRYAAKLGVNIEELVVSQPNTAEQTMDLVQDLTESGVVDIIVVDSVAALVPKAELEGDAEDLTIGQLARLLSKQLRKLTGPASRNNTTIIFINQTRDKIGGFSPFGTPQTTPGGKALKFYASQRLRVTRGQAINGDSSSKIAIGNLVKFKVEKNKIAPPFGTGESVLTYNKGINLQAELLEVGVSKGIISVTGRTYTEVETDEKMGTSKASALDTINKDTAMFERLRVAMQKAISNDLFSIDEDAENGDTTEEDSK